MDERVYTLTEKIDEDLEHNSLSEAERQGISNELKNLIHNPRDIAPVFQALRILVNDEMGELERALAAVPEKLVTGGKCICVTFHSLEDRIVKNSFKEWTKPVGDPHLPTLQEPRFVAIKAQAPTSTEIENNNRARSAHMRGVIKSY